MSLLLGILPILLAALIAAVLTIAIAPNLRHSYRDSSSALELFTRRIGSLVLAAMFFILQQKPPEPPL